MMGTIFGERSVKNIELHEWKWGILIIRSLILEEGLYIMKIKRTIFQKGWFSRNQF